VQALVEARLHANVALADMARATGFSPAQFVRLFKNTVGRTPHQFLLGARIARARALVLAGELPLHRIAELTGFAHQSHMNAAFVRAFNTPPGELRRRGAPTLPSV
jgi:AraC family transcriptional regulator